jgi:hypothetical protein
MVTVGQAQARRKGGRSKDLTPIVPLMRDARIVTFALDDARWPDECGELPGRPLR